MLILTNREKEEHQMDLVFQPRLENNCYMNKMITDTLRAKREVWLVTDLHLFVRKEKNKPECHKRANFNKVIDNLSKVHPKDLVINLGDLVDGEFQNKEELKEIMLTLPGNKILVRGNNDLFTTTFYRECGFRYVSYGFIFGNMAFTHVPIVHHEFKMNIHGHLHTGINSKRTPQYWVPYNNHIDVFDENRKPIRLQDVIASQPEYSKNIIVRMDKFMQESTSPFEDTFDYYKYNILHMDPYDD